MNKFIALCAFVLSLFGCNGGASTLVQRASADGSEVLHSRAQVQAGVARFECLRSASGQCHYTVLPRDCDPAGVARGCAAEPIERFALASGDSRQIAGLQAFRLCVSARADGPERDCGVPG